MRITRQQFLLGAAGTFVAAGIRCAGAQSSPPGSGEPAQTPNSGTTGGGTTGGGTTGGSTGTTGASSGGSSGGTTGVTPQCLETEDNILGPCYRDGAPYRTTLAQPGDGEKLIITGVVRGEGCGGLAGALVDIWQANARGAYDIRRCGGAADDPGFRWRGRMLSDADGRYTFETILPGRYLNGATYRPRHIHYKVSAAGHVPLTTQLYFSGDPFIPSDPFVHSSLVIDLTQNDGVWHGTFDVVLAKA